jgi:hypothetical protein
MPEAQFPRTPPHQQRVEELEKDRDALLQIAKPSGCLGYGHTRLPKIAVPSLASIMSPAPRRLNRRSPGDLGV